MIKELWFDLNGTLTLPSPAYNLAVRDLYIRAYATAIGQPMSATVQAEALAACRHHGSRSAVFRALGKPSNYWNAYFDSLDEAKYYKPDVRVYTTLDALRKVFTIGLLSNSSLERVERTLRAVHIDPEWFTHIITRHDVLHPKPDPEGFELLIARAEAAPHEIVYVGNRDDTDIIPAKNLGLTTALVWGHSNEADYSFADLSELVHLLP